MKSEKLGSSTSVPEVTNVSQHGFWVLLDEREIFVSFRQFPWFADATIAELSNLERPVPHHLYWPALDIDLHLDSIENPDSFPLVSGARPNRSLQRTRSARR
jgi:hypothetical protein